MLSDKGPTILRCAAPHGAILMDKQILLILICRRNADPRSEEIYVAIVQMIAVDDQPFSAVDNPGSINSIEKASIKQ
uniref:Uncharacterized protein n=1 Tax=Romanomermis culicivorax TaxID=13658 RepID=A0A915HMR9_ROMCU